MDEAGYSLVMLPVEQDIKDAIHTAAKHLNRMYGMPITEVRFRVPYVIEQLEIQNNGTLLCTLLSIQYCYNNFPGVTYHSNISEMFLQKKTGYYLHTFLQLLHDVVITRFIREINNKKLRNVY
jgi:hypothetical protein